jgi:zinc transport system permease protein
METLVEPFTLPFMVRALVAGAIVGGLCAMIGVFVVQRGLAFIGDGLAHATFGGLALGLLFGVALDHVTAVALPFTIVVALAIALILRRGEIHGDAAVGAASAISFAVGIVLLGLRPPDAQPVPIEGVLFGSILATSESDLILVAVVGAIIALILVAAWSRLAYATFDRDLASISGVPVGLFDVLLLTLTAVIIVVSVKTVGVALVSSFLILPAATARLIGHSIGRVAVLALVIGVLGAVVGLNVSYHANVASGATIILTLGAGFAVAVVTRSLRR